MEVFLALPPMVSLGSGAHEWLHRPFDASELVAHACPAVAVATV